MYFFQPKIILIIKNDKIEFHHFENINANDWDLFKIRLNNVMGLSSAMLVIESKSEYLLHDFLDL